MSPIQGTKRSQLKRKTIPLPLEIVFRPGVQETRPSQVAEEDEDDRTVRLFFEPGGAQTEIAPIEDLWRMREKFLSLEQQNPGLDGMTQAYGRFGIGLADILEPIESLKGKFTNSDIVGFLRKEYLEWQLVVRAAMTKKMSGWPKLQAKFPPDKIARLCQPMPLDIEWRNDRPTGVIRCTNILQAVIATLHIDTLIDAEYRFCACRGCTNSFKVKRRDQRYCSDDCKHRQVVRNSRERPSEAVLQRMRRQTEEKSK